MPMRSRTPADSSMSMRTEGVSEPFEEGFVVER